MFVARWALFLSIGTILGITVISVVVVFTADNIKPKVPYYGNVTATTPRKQRVSYRTTTIHPKEEARISDEILHEVTNYFKQGSPMPRLFGMLDQIPLQYLTGIVTSVSQHMKDSTICITCRSVIDALLKYYEASQSPEDLRNLVYSLCVNLKLQPEEVCAGVIDLNLDTIIYIINNTQGLTSSKICGIVLQSSDCSLDDPSLEWTLDVDLGKKQKTRKSREAATGDPTTILQLSDIHYDPTYTPYGNAECGMPMCCRKKQGAAGKPEAEAGYWGDYRSCDLSQETFESSLKHIKETHTKIDYIYMTGDIVDHAVWDTSIEKNTAVLKTILRKLKEELPNITVYPILGNHEPSPLNVYAPTSITDEKLSTKWLFELIAEEWSAWLPSETKETILKGGFYSVLAKPGFRIIGLNSNVCYTFNWWLIYDVKDPYGQLKWLAETLKKAEDAGEKVHILSHIPTGENSCQRSWSREYKKIVNRYEDTITAQFTGHSHYDELVIFYALDAPTRANNIAFNGGSLTQFDNLNSNYKMYSMDPSSYTILDAETWTFNLTEANLHNDTVPPRWYKMYSYKDMYDMESLTPDQFDKLSHRLASNRSLLENYARFYVKEADTSLNCDAPCLREKLCTLVTSQAGDKTQCNKLLEEFQSG